MNRYNGYWVFYIIISLLFIFIITSFRYFETGLYVFIGLGTVHTLFLIIYLYYESILEELSKISIIKLNQKTSKNINKEYYHIIKQSLIMLPFIIILLILGNTTANLFLFLIITILIFKFIIFYILH